MLKVASFCADSAHDTNCAAAYQTGEIDKDNAATSTAPEAHSFCCSRAALTNKAFSPTPSPTPQLPPPPPPPPALNTLVLRGPSISFLSVLLFSHSSYALSHRVSIDLHKIDYT